MCSFTKKFDLKEVPDPYYGGAQGFELVRSSSHVEPALATAIAFSLCLKKKQFLILSFIFLLSSSTEIHASPSLSVVGSATTVMQYVCSLGLIGGPVSP